jgi:hypothetical protein
MRRLRYLIFSFLNFIIITTPAIAQDDDATSEETTTQKKITRVVVPSYPTKEVRGICIDAATKAPLAGIMLSALGNDNYTAMTGDNGEFVIKVPVYATALYVHSPQYLSLQVPIVENASEPSC